MKTYGLMFKAEMIKAYMAGIKNQTRRTKGLDLINENPDAWTFTRFVKVNSTQRPLVGEVKYAEFQNPDPINGGNKWIRLPYGYIGDTLWFKETYAIICKEAIPYCYCATDEEIHKNHYVEYRADRGNPYPGDWPPDEAKGNVFAPKWESSMFMRMKYSRFQNIPVTGVSVQRLHDIDVLDALGEGVAIYEPSEEELNDPNGKTVRELYFDLWDSINGKKLPASKNPWVFVYRFPLYQKA